jgi:hypothetical protein
MAETTDRIVKQVKHMKRDEEMLALIANRMPLFLDWKLQECKYIPLGHYKWDSYLDQFSLQCMLSLLQ